MGLQVQPRNLCNFCLLELQPWFFLTLTFIIWQVFWEISISGMVSSSQTFCYLISKHSKKVTKNSKKQKKNCQKVTQNMLTSAEGLSKFAEGLSSHYVQFFPLYSLNNFYLFVFPLFFVQLCFVQLWFPPLLIQWMK